MAKKKDSKSSQDDLRQELKDKRQELYSIYSAAGKQGFSQAKTKEAKANVIPKPRDSKSIKRINELSSRIHEIQSDLDEFGNVVA